MNARGSAFGPRAPAVEASSRVATRPTSSTSMWARFTRISRCVTTIVADVVTSSHVTSDAPTTKASTPAVVPKGTKGDGWTDHETEHDEPRPDGRTEALAVPNDIAGRCPGVVCRGRSRAGIIDGR